MPHTWFYSSVATPCPALRGRNKGRRSVEPRDGPGVMFSRPQTGAVRRVEVPLQIKSPLPRISLGARSPQLLANSQDLFGARVLGIIRVWKSRSHIAAQANS